MNEDGTPLTLFKSALIVVVALATGAGAALVISELQGGNGASADDAVEIASATSVPEPTVADPVADELTEPSDAAPSEPASSAPTSEIADDPGADGTISDGTAASDATEGSGAAGSTTPSSEPTHFRIVATGEVLPQEPLWEQAAENGAASGVTYDYRPMFEAITPTVGRADLGICHLETPVAPDGEEFTPYPDYGVQPEIVEALVNAGYDECSTSSNHALDRGPAGVKRTIEVMEWHGLGFSGTARDAAEAGPKIIDVKGVKVAHLSYSYGFNGQSGDEYSAALIDPEKIISDAGAARSEGAQVVVVSMHWGVEGQHKVSEEQREVAEQITASGAIDLVIGHHAHVIQPIEQINGTWVLFGTGNLLSDLPDELPDGQEWPAATQDGAMFDIAVDVDPNGEVTVQEPAVIPTWVDKEDGYKIVPVQEAIEGGRYSGAELTALEESLQRTADVVGPFFAVDPQPAKAASTLDTDVPEAEGDVSLA